jgi:hypothetical protein
LSARPEPALRPEFGPSLPQLLRARLGVPERISAAVALAAVVVAAVVVIASRGGDVHYIHRSDPVFNLRYAPVLHRVPARGGVLFELDGRRGSLFLQSLVIRPLRLPAYRGSVSGMLPVYAARRMELVRRRYTDLAVLDEGKARVGGAPGYQIGFRARLGGRTVFGRQVLVVPDEPGARDGVMMTVVQTHAAGAHSLDDVGNVGAIKKAFRSFRFGTEGK